MVSESDANSVKNLQQKHQYEILKGKQYQETLLVKYREEALRRENYIQLVKQRQYQEALCRVRYFEYAWKRHLQEQLRARLYLDYIKRKSYQAVLQRTLYLEIQHESLYQQILLTKRYREIWLEKQSQSSTESEYQEYLQKKRRFYEYFLSKQYQEFLQRKLYYQFLQSKFYREILPKTVPDSIIERNSIGIWPWKVSKNGLFKVFYVFGYHVKKKSRNIETLGFFMFFRFYLIKLLFSKILTFFFS